MPSSIVCMVSKRTSAAKPMSETQFNFSIPLNLLRGVNILVVVSRSATSDPIGG